MEQPRHTRLSLIICVLGLFILTTPLINLLSSGKTETTLIRTGASLFAFWMLLIVLTVIANRFHRALPQLPHNNQVQPTDQDLHAGQAQDEVR